MEKAYCGDRGQFYALNRQAMFIVATQRARLEGSMLLLCSDCLSDQTQDVGYEEPEGTVLLGRSQGQDPWFPLCSPPAPTPLLPEPWAGICNEPLSVLLFVLFSL